jgi:hypothetical protein
VATTQQPRSGRGRSGGGQRSERSPARQSKSNPRTATVRLPFVTAEFRRPDMHLPQVQMPDVRGNVTGAVNAVWENLPPREQIAYFGGLGLLAALAVIEWPVAAAIGVGTVIAQRGGGSSRSGSTSSAGSTRAG